jgi:hypothetical protein
MTPKILVYIKGGIVAAVCTNQPECKVVIVDFDDHAILEEHVYVSAPRPQDDWFEDGKAAEMFDPLDKNENVAAQKLLSINY